MGPQRRSQKSNKSELERMDTADWWCGSASLLWQRHDTGLGQFDDDLTLVVVGHDIDQQSDRCALSGDAPNVLAADMRIRAMESFNLCFQIGRARLNVAANITSSTTGLARI